jgi:hypothetical protein
MDTIFTTRFRDRASGFWVRNSASGFGLQASGTFSTGAAFEAAPAQKKDPKSEARRPKPEVEL